MKKRMVDEMGFSSGTSAIPDDKVNQSNDVCFRCLPQMFGCNIC